MERSGSDKIAKSLAWECDVSLITQPAIVGGMAKVWLIAGVLMFALVGGMVGLQDGIEAVIPLAELLLMILGGLFVLSLLIMLIVFGNRLRMAFAIDGKGIVVQMVDRRAKAANRLAAVVGAMAGKPGVAGAGLIAMHDEERSAVWSSIAAAIYNPARRTITLKNSWRTVLHVFCTPENYDAVAARIAAEISGAERPAPSGRNPIWGARGLSAVVVLAVLPLFGMPRGFEAPLLAVILTLCFALATIWLVPLMAWPVLGGIGWIVATIALRGAESKVNQFTGAAYTSFDRLDQVELAGLVVATIGVAVLMAICVGALRGKISSVLMRDTEEMVDGK
jgi:hypothetical protein